MRQKGFFIRRLAGVVALVIGSSAAARVGTAGVEAKVKAVDLPVRYNRHVLPILLENCFSCHGPDQAARKAGLRLDRRENALAEAESGAHPIVPGNPDESEMIFRVTATDEEDIMPQPKSGKTLTKSEIAILHRWIEEGAAYETHWAFVPPERVASPEIPNGAHPVDRFILDRLKREGLTPAPEAGRATLIRRLSLDLIGLPPEPSAVDAFLRDDRPGSYDRLVDGLLASPHFGEKWARWWLDLAHYGDSDGIRLDAIRPHAWRYRQQVVDAFNDDLPFNEFAIEQVAGDLLPGATTAQRIAAGFWRNTTSDRQTGNATPEIARVRKVVDRTATFGTVWLGLSTGCAECHDHKYDPISQREFYQLYAFFNDMEEVNVDAPQLGEWEAYHPAKERYDRERAALLAPVADVLEKLQARWEQGVLLAETDPAAELIYTRAFEILVAAWGRGEGGGQREGLMIIKTLREERTAGQRERLQDHFMQNGKAVDPEAFAELGIADLAKKLAALRKKLPPLTRAQTIQETPFFRTTRIHVRGDFRRPGDPVARGTPAVLPPLRVEGPATRLDLARWLVSPENPLTARVVVNRLWQESFGQGLVVSSDNLGTRGDLPTHPELLDWLAVEFMDRGWSLKTILRLLVTSATYRQSSAVRPEIERRDPGNALLARQVRLRLSAEQVRDSLLVASGLLNPEVGGPSVRPPRPAGVKGGAGKDGWVADQGEARYRRGLYTFIQRLAPFAPFVTFDLPDTATSCSRRERSNTPLQALNLLNDPVFMEAAKTLAYRILKSENDSFNKRLDYAFKLSLGRTPEAVERQRLKRYIDEQAAIMTEGEVTQLFPVSIEGVGRNRAAAWVGVSSILLNLDEFITRE